MELTKVKKEYTGTAGRILKYLCAGCSDLQAAQACGVDITLVSHLKNESEFAEQISEALRVGFANAQEIDTMYDEIEKQAVKKLKEAMSFPQSVDTYLRIATNVNKAIRKMPQGNPALTEGVNGSAPVTLVLPNAVIQNFVVNPNNEIVKVGDQNLSTLNSKSIDSLLKKRKLEKEKELQNTSDAEIIEPKPVQVRLINEDKWSNL